MTERSFALLGHPLGHSLSPVLHRLLFSLRGDPALYRLYDAPPAQFEAAVRLLAAQTAGFNVTIPYKQQILPLLAEVHGCAARCGAVNTVAVRPDGLHGYNTDADGFLYALREAGLPLRGRVLLLGSGGAARVFALLAAQAGAQLSILVRPGSLARGQALQAQLTHAVPDAACRVLTQEPAEDFDLLLNATPVGMFPHTEEVPVSQALLRRCAGVFDAVYNPRPTLLLQQAAANGSAVCDGLPMLVAQAAAAQRIWCGYSYTSAQLAEVCRRLAQEAF
ncbi:MAG: shikimate dehydrogenase [Clostridia bacterium]|nr:shikimate dehydrogenase [Clostridia bacterium]